MYCIRAHNLLVCHRSAFWRFFIYYTINFCDCQADRGAYNAPIARDLRFYLNRMVQIKRSNSKNNISMADRAGPDRFRRHIMCAVKPRFASKSDTYGRARAPYRSDLAFRNTSSGAIWRKFNRKIAICSTVRNFGPTRTRAGRQKVFRECKKRVKMP